MKLHKLFKSILVQDISPIVVCDMEDIKEFSGIIDWPYEVAK